MAYEYDRFEREEGGGSFLMGLLAGTVLGAGLGMLFAPKTGSELRSQLGNQIADQTGRLREVADQGYQQATEKVSQMMDRGREAYDRARSSVGNMAPAGTTGSSPTQVGTTSTSGGATSSSSNYGSSSGGSQGGGYGA
jgi:gas vesicle protein